MGFLNEMANIWAKAQGSLIIQNILLAINYEAEANDGLSIKKISEACINKAWEKHPDVFNGKFGRPHKLITALVGVTEMLDSNKNTLDYSYVVLVASTINLLKEIEVNHNFYPFTHIDYTMLEKMILIVENEIQAYNEQYGEFEEQLSLIMPTYHKL